MVSNLILLIASLIMIGTGGALMGFYRVHLLDMVSIEFLIVPIFMVVGGVFAFFTAIFGFYASSKEDSCLLISHATFMMIQLLILVGGVISSIRLIFFIQTGLFNADVAAEIQLYDSNSWIRYKWDTLQREFTCCGGYQYNLGYQDWKKALIGQKINSVPDSCCLTESFQCGAKVFDVVDPKKVVERIHTHGCITIMQRRLEDHVMVSKRITGLWRPNNILF